VTGYLVSLGYFIDTIGRVWFEVRPVVRACRAALGGYGDAYELLGGRG
jgi:hypothetical protein